MASVNNRVRKTLYPEIQRERLDLSEAEVKFHQDEAELNTLNNFLESPS